MSKIDATAMFFLLFKIPWIWKWEFVGKNEERPCLKRIFFCKWWKKFDEESSLQVISNHIQALKDSKPKLSIGENPFKLVMENIKKRNPELSNRELLIQTMNFMKEQMVEVQSDSGSDDTTMGSNSSLNILAGESQNPDDVDEGTIDDYWEAMTEMILRNSKGKGKKKL